MKNVKVMKIGKVVETTLYKFFNLLILAVPYSELIKENGILQFDEINRQTNDKHIKKMSLSLKLLGLLRCPVVVFDEKTGRYKVLDGQHLIKGSKETKESEIYCIVYNGKEKAQAMRTLNNTQKPWKFADFVKQSALEGKKDYQILLKVLKEKIVSDSVLPMILTLKSRQEARNEIVKGEFKIVNKNYRKVLDDIKTFYTCNVSLPKSRQYHEKLVLLMLNTKKFNSMQFVMNLSKVTIENKGNDETAIAEQLKEIYEGKTLRVAA